MADNFFKSLRNIFRRTQVICEMTSHFCNSWESRKPSPTETDKPKCKSLIATVTEHHAASFIGKGGTSPFSLNKHKTYCKNSVQAFGTISAYIHAAFL